MSDTTDMSGGSESTAAELRAKVNELLRCGLSEVEVAHKLHIEVQTVRLLIGTRFCEDCE